MSKQLAEILREQVDEYLVSAVLKESETNPNPQSGAAKSKFITVRLKPKSKPNTRSSRSLPTLTLFETRYDGQPNLADKEMIDQIKACAETKDGETFYNPQKLKSEVDSVEGVFYEFQAPTPYFILNNEGKRQVYPPSNKDAGKPVIGMTIPMFLYSSQIENVDQILMDAMSGREQIPLEEAKQAVSQNQYENYRAQKILEDFVQEESGGKDGEEVVDESQ